jgi:hypothetical protein
VMQRCSRYEHRHLARGTPDILPSNVRNLQPRGVAALASVDAGRYVHWPIDIAEFEVAECDLAYIAGPCVYPDPRSMLLWFNMASSNVTVHPRRGMVAVS